MQASDRERRPLLATLVVGCGKGYSLAADDVRAIAQQQQVPGEAAEVGYVPGSTTMATGIGARAEGISSPAAASEAVHAWRELHDFLQLERDLSDLVDSLAL